MGKLKSFEINPFGAELPNPFGAVLPSPLGAELPNPFGAVLPKTKVTKPNHVLPSPPTEILTLCQADSCCRLNKGETMQLKKKDGMYCPSCVKEKGFSNRSPDMKNRSWICRPNLDWDCPGEGFCNKHYAERRSEAKKRKELLKLEKEMNRAAE